jgi:putative N-acetylmannosamine-6-phosphate epimerase
MTIGQQDLAIIALDTALMSRSILIVWNALKIRKKLNANLMTDIMSL